MTLSDEAEPCSFSCMCQKGDCTASASGLKALLVTVDSPVIGTRDDDDHFKVLSASLAEEDLLE